MSYEEYFDLYLIAQDNPNSLYYVISFDIVNSKKIPPKRRFIIQENINEIVKYVYNKLLNKEKELNIQIVIKDEKFIRPWDSKNSRWNGNYIDPFILGDCFQFTILRNTISKEEIIEWVNECRRALNMEVEFHITDGYYETNDYGEGGTKFFRGYCLQILETFHKQKTQIQIQKIKRKYNL